jgi:hypothetical protein
MDFHVPGLHEIADFLVQFPVIAVLLAGVLFGTGFTQMVKKTYAASQSAAMNPVSEARFRISIRWLSVVSTFAFSLWLWHEFLMHTGGEEVLCAGTAFLSPLIYDWTRALIAWKFPSLVASWGAKPPDPPKP